MKRTNSGLPTFVYMLAGMLAISAVMLTMSKRAGRTEPSVGSYGVSGLRLLGELLREDGYEVEATRDPTPKLDPTHDVAVAVSTNEQQSSRPRGEGVEPPAIWSSLEAFEKVGGRSIYSQIGADFQAVTRASREDTITSPYSEANAHIFGASAGLLEPAWLGSEPEATTIYELVDRPWAALQAKGEGRRLYVADFSGATNRFIDRSQNASVYLALIKSFAPHGSRLVFVEASWGNASEPGFFESIGPWAEAAWGQLLVLGLVIVYTLGKPFGIPDAKRPRQRGQRELVDAYATTLRRAAATDIALAAVLSDADRRLRRSLKIDTVLGPDQLEKALPPALIDLLERTRAAIAAKAPVDIALALAERLDSEVTAFTGDRRQKVRRRSKS